LISFDNINKPNWKYTLLYRYVKFVHHYIFYRRFYVLHSGRIPKGDPIVAICNHQNGPLDAVGIIFAFKKDGRYPVCTARADLFEKEIVAKILRLMRIMPVFRAKDLGNERLTGNYGTFDKSAEILANDNGVVCIFPEAEDEYLHHLRTFKKGFARIAFAAAEKTNFEKTIWILPTSNHYSNYFGMRNKLIVTIGEPFTFEDLYDIYKQNPPSALKMLADRAHEKVSAIMLDIKDLNLYEAYNTIRRLCSREYVKKEGLSARYFPNILEADRKIVATLDKLRNDDSEKFNTLMMSAKEYGGIVGQLHLSDRTLCQKINFGAVLLRCLSAILLVPFIIYGFIVNFIPINADTPVPVRIKDKISHPAFLFFTGVLLIFPLWYLTLFIVAWCVTGVWWIAFIYFISLPVSLVIYIHSKNFVKNQYNLLRCFCLDRFGNCLYLRAMELRKEVIEMVERLMK